MKRVTLLVLSLFAMMNVSASGQDRYWHWRHRSGLLSITTASLPGGTVGAPYTGQIAASGGTQPYTYSASGLPGGLSINGSTGTITGTPSQNSVGTTPAAITVADSTSTTPQSATANLAITVAATSPAGSLSITTTSLPGGTSGVAYTGSVTASGGTAPYTYSASNLPSGLSINPWTGAITGTSSAVEQSAVALTVTDSTAPTAQTATSNLSMTINSPTTAGGGASCGNMSTGESSQSQWLCAVPIF